MPHPTLWQEIRSIAALSFPIAISLAAATLITVVDTIMIAPLGTVPLAAASITGTFLIVMYSGLFGFVSATGVRMAEAHGKSDPDALTDATHSGLVVGLGTGLIGMGLMLTLLPLLPYAGQPADVVAIVPGYWTAMAVYFIPFTLFYMLKGLFDAVDRPWVGVILAFGAVLLNMPANYVLIHGIGGWEGFGLLGAGLASLLSETVSLIAAVIIWRKSAAFAAARTKALSTWSEIRKQLREGTTIALGYVGEGGAYAVVGFMMGWFSAAALAAHQIVNAVGGVLYMVPLGVAIAVSIIIGQTVGAGATARLQMIGRAAMIFIVGWMTLVMVFILIARGPITTALSDDPAVIGLAITLFLISALMQIADGIQSTMLGACRGMTDNAIPVLITMISYWVLALPTGYVLGFWLDWGPVGVWIGYSLGLAIAATLVTRRFFRKAHMLQA
ncbi:MATE family efflux transporter [Shimia ponticola]|uniref:MATE family efflux transporter n=1 Tax=Shimia ponticola TaxID=2582893 RepID=UPI0011BD9A0D|nr:MATE family efflux transporter [Shimia ponticola]